MLATVVVKDAADRDRLRRLAPGIEIRETDSLLTCAPALAARAEGAFPLIEDTLIIGS